MSRWVVLFKENDDLNNISSFVYHKSFETREEANDKGIEWCKMHEEAFSKIGLDYEYDRSEEHTSELQSLG